MKAAIGQGGDVKIFIAQPLGTTPPGDYPSDVQYYSAHAS